MYSDKHYPPTFLSGNKSLRDMFTDPSEYDRRMTNITERSVETKRNEEMRAKAMKRIADEQASRQLMAIGQTKPPPASNYRSYLNMPEKPKEEKITHTSTRTSRSRPSFAHEPQIQVPERNFTMFTHSSSRWSDRASSFDLNNRAGSVGRYSYHSHNPSSVPSSSKRPDAQTSWYMVRPRAASLTGPSEESKCEIVPVGKIEQNISSNGVHKNVPEKRQQQFYTDKYFSRQFLSDSKPLSAMIVRKQWHL